MLLLLSFFLHPISPKYLYRFYFLVLLICHLLFCYANFYSLLKFLYFLLKPFIQIKGYSVEHSSLLILWANCYHHVTCCHCLRCPWFGPCVRLWLDNTCLPGLVPESSDIQVMFLHSCPSECSASTKSRSSRKWTDYLCEQFKVTVERTSSSFLDAFVFAYYESGLSSSPTHGASLKECLNIPSTLTSSPQASFSTGLFC